MADQAESLRKEVEAFEKQQNSTRVITIASGKGGVGKSILAVNLGLRLAETGKKVTILDADFGLANINVILGILPKFTLYHVFKGEKNLGDILIEVDDNFNIIAGAAGFFQLANLETSKREKLLEQMQTLDHNDYLIIDAGAGISENVINLMQSSDESIIVTTPEPTAITDAYGIIKTVSSLNKDQHEKDLKLNLVLNRVKNFLEAKKVSHKIQDIVEQFLDVKINYLGFILDDPLVTSSVRAQEPFIKSYPNSKASFCVNNLVYSLTKSKPDQYNSGLVRFFKNFLGSLKGISTQI
ncbi:MAG: MinD/ParA family protein [Spirochaetes bacterium]|nr:MinD/ParA family protein [Spirochaetota bacterium]